MMITEVQYLVSLLLSSWIWYWILCSLSANCEVVNYQWKAGSYTLAIIKKNFVFEVIVAAMTKSSYLQYVLKLDNFLLL